LRTFRGLSERANPEYIVANMPLGLASADDYRARLRDTAFWTAHVHSVLDRHGLPHADVLAADRSTFPTFLVGDSVVKFFGEYFDGLECFEIECSVDRAFLTGQLEVAVPRLVGDGQLLEDDRSWHYTIARRLPGAAWGTLDLSPHIQSRVAGQLGGLIRRVHDLACPSEPVFRRHQVAELRASAAARHREWGTLAAHLVDQIDTYLAPPSTTRRLIHADLHDEHVLVDDGQLVGVIDWGDATCADPYYELPSLFLWTFAQQKPLLRVFLQAYGWSMPADFAHRALTMTLIHEFNPLQAVESLAKTAPSLEALASRLWDLSDPTLL
jgi:hygromycin-B 7''-O-kinase